MDVKVAKALMKSTVKRARKGHFAQNDLKKIDEQPCTGCHILLGEKCCPMMWQFGNIRAGIRSFQVDWVAGVSSRLALVGQGISTCQEQCGADNVGLE